MAEETATIQEEVWKRGLTDLHDDWRDIMMTNKVVKLNTLKHIHSSEQIVYKIFKAFPLCSLRDAVLDVTNEETTTPNGARRFIHVSKSLPLNESDKIFPKKMSYQLKRRRSTILFEGYRVTEVRRGSGIWTWSVYLALNHRKSCT